MSNSLFTIALMIGYIGLAKVFNWSAESLWGLGILFAASAFLILREAFPNYFGVLNARANVIHFQHQTIKRKDSEIQKMKLALREVHEELKGVHALWMNSKSATTSSATTTSNSIRATLSAARTAKTVETILATQRWDLMAANAELSDDERTDIASRIIQQVLPVSNFRNYSISEDLQPIEVSSEDNFGQETFIIDSAMFQSVFPETTMVEDAPIENPIIENNSVENAPIESENNNSIEASTELTFIENESFEMAFESIERQRRSYDQIDFN